MTFAAVLVLGLLAAVACPACSLKKLVCDSTGPLQVKDVLFVVQSQANPYHEKRASALKKSWQKVLKQEDLAVDSLRVIFTHEGGDNMEGAWAVFPLMSALLNNPKAMMAKWIFICEDTTEILSFVRLLTKLGEHQYCAAQFLGHALRDREASITHHYAFADNPSSFAYPDFASGWALSLAFLKRIGEQMKEDRIQSGFTIDAQHEIAKYIYDKFGDFRMTPVDWLCSGKSPGEAAAAECITNFRKELESCGSPLQAKNLYFGVKTTEKFHKSRLPVLLKTWAQPLVDGGHMTLYSNVTDETVPTVDCGVPNTEHGHCGKLYAIMTDSVEATKDTDRSWLVITDDDTLMSVPRLLTLLSCYDGNEAVAVGEVYGYGANAGHGYSYLTGGGGFILSRPAAVKLVDASKTGVCGCATDDSPDDMFLGMCLRALRIPVIHRPEFHQARPGEYAAEYLNRQTPVSFHRHTFHDPYKSYDKYLSSGAEVNNDETPAVSVEAFADRGYGNYGEGEGDEEVDFPGGDEEITGSARGVDSEEIIEDSASSHHINFEL